MCSVSEKILYCSLDMYEQNQFRSNLKELTYTALYLASLFKIYRPRDIFKRMSFSPFHILCVHKARVENKISKKLLHLRASTTKRSIL